jgi:hypothetical protein
MENLTSGQVKQEYEKGRRNFDGIKSSGQDFHGFVLKGSSFKKADLSWSHFDTADFSDCDFSEANLMWSGIRHVNLRNTIFFKANVSYSDFNSSIFDNTDFRKADLTACLLFNVNMGGAKIEGANMSWTATGILQLDEEGLKFVLKNLEQMGRQIPPELMTHVRLVVAQIHEKSRQLSELKLAYNLPGRTLEQSAVYSSSITSLQREITSLSNKFHRLYNEAIEYGSNTKDTSSPFPKYKK